LIEFVPREKGGEEWFGILEKCFVDAVVTCEKGGEEIDEVGAMSGWDMRDRRENV
jgi:hypothetical protein